MSGIRSELWCKHASSTQIGAAELPYLRIKVFLAVKDTTHFHNPFRYPPSDSVYLCRLRAMDFWTSLIFLFAAKVHLFSSIPLKLPPMGTLVGGVQLPPLHAASRDGDLGAVRSLLKRIDVMTRDAWGETALHWASTSNVAECLIAAGATVNVVDPTGDTPLHWAVENANVAVAQLLLENGADVNRGMHL